LKSSAAARSPTQTQRAISSAALVMFTRCMAKWEAG
jgi:hypothetical protein